MSGPSDADSVGFAETWATFCGLERTLGPSGGAVEAWRRGRDRYVVWVLRVTDPAVLQKMGEVSERLAGAIVRVPPEDAHVTVWVAGFPAVAPVLDDDVAELCLAAQRTAAARLRPPRLFLGQPNAFATCAFLEVHDPHGDLAALRTALAVPGAREVRFARYQAHVTVGRFAETRPTTPIARAIGALRERKRNAPIAVDGCALELTELDARAPGRLTTVWPPPTEAISARASEDQKAPSRTTSPTTPT